MVVMMVVLIPVLPVTTVFVMMPTVIAVAAMVIPVSQCVAAEGQRKCSKCSTERLHDQSRVGNTLPE